jgi:hypothetical protein
VTESLRSARIGQLSSSTDTYPEGYTDASAHSERCPMKGIEYVVDENGKRRAVVIDLEEHGELWEDVYDAYLVEQRSTEPTEPLEDLVNRLRAQGKLDGER